MVADDDRRRNDEIFITFMVKVNEVNEVAPSGPHEGKSGIRVSVPLGRFLRGGTEGVVGDRRQSWGLGPFDRENNL